MNFFLKITVLLSSVLVIMLTSAWHLIDNYNIKDAVIVLEHGCHLAADRGDRFLMGAVVVAAPTGTRGAMHGTAG